MVELLHPCNKILYSRDVCYSSSSKQHVVVAVVQHGELLHPCNVSGVHFPPSMTFSAASLRNAIYVVEMVSNSSSMME